MRGYRALSGLSVVALCALVITGCTEEEKPSKLPPLPSTASASASASSSSSGSASGSGSPGAPSAKPTATAAVPKEAQSLPAPTTPAKIPSGLTKDQREVVDLAKSYFSAVTSALNSGNTEVMRPYTPADCNCARTLTYIKKYWGRGHVEAPNYFVPLSFAPPRLSPDTKPVTGLVSARILENAQRNYDAEGNLVSYSEAKKNTQIVVSVDRRDGRWTIVDVS